MPDPTVVLVVALLLLGTFGAGWRLGRKDLEAELESILWNLDKEER